MRARGAGRLLRRRPRQLLLPAPRPGLRLLPRLRERPAGPPRALVPLEPRRARTRATWSSSPAIPGTTKRLYTVAQLEYERGLRPAAAHPAPRAAAGRLRRLRRAGPEQARQARDRMRGLENNLKRQRGFLEVLSDSARDRRRGRAAERAAAPAHRPQPGGLAASRPSPGSASRPPWRSWAAPPGVPRCATSRALSRLRGHRQRARALHRRGGAARTRSASREYRDSRLDSERFRLLSPAPDPSRDGGDDPRRRAAAVPRRARPRRRRSCSLALGGRAPQAVAHELIAGTKLGDAAVRKALLEGGATAVAASKDPLIVWARRLDAPYRELRTWYEDQVAERRDAGRRPDRAGALRARRPRDAAGRHRLAAALLRRGRRLPAR